ncbi:glycosyltransferase [Devosia sp.]|jgi:glycosyltransferase Alg8|uniref:glycosyltransferase n=1 Tax=Devosia sp. TaxID=1871048 RepID=UPI0037C03A40
MLGHLVYILLVAAVVLTVPSPTADAEVRAVLVVIGLIGLWRYGWAMLHLGRSLWFRKVWFPPLRKRAEAALSEDGVGHAFMLLTSFRIDEPTTTKVYAGAFRAAARAAGGATVVASIVEPADEWLISHLATAMYGESLPFGLEFVRIPGTGKRDALAHGFRAIAKHQPGPHDTVSVIDGDSIVPDDLIERCAGFFLVDARLGALTTDEVCTVEGAEIFRKWYSMRFVQRQILMCSNGLSKRVLTLTGRMSMFRAQLACDPTFIDHIQNDEIEHWRLGKIRMLTGDDKSSWFWLLSRGYHIYYVPDVVVETIEQPPSPNFVESARVLMTRWFGNMLRTNARALALGPHKIGFFTWWAVLDQRLSMWTSLSGLSLAVLGSFFVSGWTLVYYVLWVMISRYLVVLSFLTTRPVVSVWYVPLLYFNQIFGSFIKILVFFRLDRQRWTRQNTTLKPSDTPIFDRFKRYSSVYVTVVAVAVYLAALAVVSGVGTPQRTMPVGAQASIGGLI